MSADDSPIVLDAGAAVHLARGDAFGVALDEEFSLRRRRIAPIISSVTLGEILRIARRQRHVTANDDVSDDQVTALLANLNVVSPNGLVAAEYARLSAALDDRGDRTDSVVVWVAATASAARGSVITHRRAFEVFKDEVTCHIVDRSPFERPAP